MQIAIMGTAPSSRFLAPFDDPTWDIWACSPCYDVNKKTFCELPRINRFFELHRLDGEELRGKLNEQELVEYHAWLKQIAKDGCTVVTQKADDIEGGIAYPLAEVTMKFGRYITNTISYMIAAAILEGATKIGIYGVDMAASEEYGSQRPSCEFWIGLATGLGIEVIIPETSDLMKARQLYAFEQPGAFPAKLRVRQAELSQRLSKAKLEAEMHGRACAAATAAAEELDNVVKLFNGEATPERLADIGSRKERLLLDAQQAAHHHQESRDVMLALTGAEEDTKYWEQWT